TLLISSASSPLRYASSSPVRATASRLESDLRSDMTERLRSSRGAAAHPGSSYRGDIGGSTLLSTPGRRRRVFVDTNGAPLPSKGGDDLFGPSSSAADATSEADADNGKVIWGTNISIEKTRANFRRFLLEFRQRDRMRLNQE